MTRKERAKNERSKAEEMRHDTSKEGKEKREVKEMREEKQGGEAM